MLDIAVQNIFYIGRRIRSADPTVLDIGGSREQISSVI